MIENLIHRELILKMIDPDSKTRKDLNEIYDGVLKDWKEEIFREVGGEGDAEL